MTQMIRRTTCNGCGYTQTTNSSYYLDKKMWRATHTIHFCNDRKAIIAQLDFTKLGNYINNQKLLNSLK